MSHTDQGQADQGQETLGREACAHAHIHTHSHSHSPRLLHAYLLAWVEVLPAVAGSTALAGGCGGACKKGISGRECLALLEKSMMISYT
jgi:hypothetical protein